MKRSSVPMPRRRFAILTLAALVLGLSVVAAPPASAAPAVPLFSKPPDPYAQYVGQTTCDPTEKPGVQDFRSLVLAEYPQTSDLGIVRACDVGPTSEHKEGRAWDWGVSASSQASIASDLLNWLLATREGSAHALARRLGIMYIIWNHQVWRAYEAASGWQPYSGTNPHTDHVHFSFSWAGARQQTTWWTARLDSGVDVASWGPGRLDVFTRGNDQQLWHKWFDSGQWSGWEPLGGTLTSDPTAVSRSDGVIDVFARGGDNQLVQRAFVRGQGWSAWVHHGGTLTSAPDAASWGAQRVDVFARGGDNQLVHLFFDGSWAPSWDHLGGTLTSAPSAVSWGPSRIDVFARGGSNELVHRYYAGGWAGSWDHLGGTLTSGPDAASWGSSRLDVFARGGDGQLVHRYYASGWAPSWDHLGGTLYSDPGAVSWGPSRIDVFARGGSDELVQRYYAGGWAGSWTHLGNLP
jgi:hypothetical protein